jgi:NADH-quinone oxidoreductase subunit E
MDYAKTIKNIIERYPVKRGVIIQILQDVHEEYNYLPRPALDEVAKQLELPVAKVYSVATFYKAFSLKERGKIIIKVCKGTACHIRGAELICNEIETLLGVKGGETTPDLEYTIEEVNCVGACAMAPVVVINDKYHGSMKPEKMRKLVKK